MLKIQEVVNFVQDELNTIANEEYTFNINAEVGEVKNGTINGVLYTVGVNTSPISNYIESEYTFVVEVSVPTPRANSNVLSVKEIIEGFVSTNDGSTHEFAEGKGGIAVNPSVPKDFKVADNIGDSVNLYATIKITYTENGVLSGVKKWFLDGYEIPYLNENVLVDKQGAIRNINGKQYTEAFLMGQTRYYKFVFPYVSNELGNMIQADLLEGNFDKEYTLSYYDGINYTEEQPFEHAVSIYKSGDSGSQALKVSMFNLTFADVYEAVEGVTYSIALIDNPFDSGSDNSRWFDSQQEQIAYYEAKAQAGAIFEEIKAPNLNSLDITSQVYPNSMGYDIIDLTNKNYAIIKVEHGTYGEITYSAKYLYYYVNSAQIGAGNQVMFDLSLDTVQTYFFEPNIDFGDCYVERASLNRFVDNGDGTVSFDGTVNSKLFEREPVQNAPKRLTKRTKLPMCNTGNETFDNWINTNVASWTYVYINPNAEIKSLLYGSAEISPVYDAQGSLKFRRGIKNKTSDSSEIYNPIPVLVFPNLLHLAETVPGDNSFLDFIYGTHSLTAQSTDMLKDFLKENSGANTILSIKVSNVCPFTKAPAQWYIDGQDERHMIIGMEVEEDINLGLEGTVNGVTYRCYTGYDKNNGLAIARLNDADGTLVGRCCLYVSYQPQNYNLGNYSVDKSLTFNKSIFNDTLVKSPTYNPKLLGQDFFELNLGDDTGNSFTYDLQKLNKTSLEITLTETLCPDNQKKYLRITNTDGVYSPDTAENMTGFVSTNDNSVIFYSTAYETMLANNKNFFTQANFNRTTNFIEGALSGAGKMLVSGFSGDIGGAVSGGMSMLGGLFNGVKDTINQNFQIDNLKRSPASVNNALGNAYFNAQITELGCYVEEYDILPAEKEIVNDFMVQYGFTANQIGNLFDYLNIRKYFNYIKANINSISGVSMSNVARNDLRRRFAEGIRFWNSDTIDYDKENYEKWLEETQD